MHQETKNLHKLFRNNIMNTSFDYELNTIQSLSELVDNIDDTIDDYDLIVRLTDYYSTVFSKADANLKEVILGILIVDNYKYLYKSLWSMELETEDFDQLILYKKLDDLSILKKKIKIDNNFFYDVLRNVIDLYYMTSEEEYLFIQKGIKNTPEEKKLLELDKTFINDVLEYDGIEEYDLDSLAERYNKKAQELEIEYGIGIIPNMILPDQIYHSLLLLSKYDKELFNQNMYQIIMHYYNCKKEEIKVSGTGSFTKKEILFMYQIENTSIIKIIDLFAENKEFFLDIISNYFLKEKEKIKQKNPK